MHVPTVSSCGSPNAIGPKPLLTLSLYSHSLCRPPKPMCGWPPLRFRSLPEESNQIDKLLHEGGGKFKREVPREGSYGGWLVSCWLVGCKVPPHLPSKHPVNPAPLDFWRLRHFSLNYNATNANLAPNANWSVLGRECHLNVVHEGEGGELIT